MNLVETPITPDEHEQLLKWIASIEHVEHNSQNVCDVENARRLLVVYRERLAASCWRPIAGGTLGHEPAPDSIEVARIRDSADPAAIIVELHELAAALQLGHTYTVTLGHMSRATFENLPEFQG